MNQPETILIVGPSGCGKTYTLLNEILALEYGKQFDFIIILCPTIWINMTYLDWGYLESDPDVIGLDISPERLDLVIEAIVKIYSGCKTAVIVDDMSSTNEQHLNNSMLTFLSYSGRHHNITLFILTQKLNSVATGIRDNTTRLIFFSTHNRRSMKVLRDEFFGHIADSETEKSIIAQLTSGRYLDIKLNAQPPTYEVK